MGKPARDHSSPTRDPKSSPSVDWREFLRARRGGVLRCAKKTKPMPNNNNGGNGRGSVHWNDFLKARRGVLRHAKKTKPINSGESGSDFLADPVSHDLQEAAKSWFEKKVLNALQSCLFDVVQCNGNEIAKTISDKELHVRIIKYGPNDCKLEVRGYMRDIVLGLAGCKSIPENILLMRGYLLSKIADFGLAKEMTDEDDNIREIMGLSYMSPELVIGDNHSDWPADIWAPGCVVVEMLIGKRVWSSKNSGRIGYSDELSEISSGLSPMAIDFLRGCLVRRMSA